MIYLRKTSGGKQLLLRDLEERDVEPILEYWYGSDPAFLRGMGIDVDRFPDRQARREFFRAMIGADPKRDPSFLWIGDYEGRAFGYALFNHIVRGDSCQAHLHIIDARFRRQGLTSALFTEGLVLIPELLKVNTAVLEPCADNHAINAFVQAFGLKPVRTYRKPAQGICREMNVNRYELRLGAPDTACGGG